jgi:penicillin-binding protein 1A
MRRSETGGTTAAPAFSYFMKSWLVKNPNTKKYFVRPKGVFTHEVRGQDFLFTKISNVPQEYMEPTILDGDQTQEFDPVIF